jgi:hypothetical protein
LVQFSRFYGPLPCVTRKMRLVLRPEPAPVIAAVVRGVDGPRPLQRVGVQSLAVGWRPRANEAITQFMTVDYFDLPPGARERCAGCGGRAAYSVTFQHENRSMTFFVCASGLGDVLAAFAAVESVVSRRGAVIAPPSGRRPARRLESLESQR